MLYCVTVIQVDATNAFNSLNRQVALRNVSTYVHHSQKFSYTVTELMSVYSLMDRQSCHKGTTQRNPLAMAM